MRKAEARLLRAALRFGAWREQASRTKEPEDRSRFVRAELVLGLAAQAFFEEALREERRVKIRRKKS